ncbi:MAG: NAD-dependent epimerase [Bacteroidales bacterium]|nr:NAD-dependent epimerase [Bacteroidales bacterium]
MTEYTLITGSAGFIGFHLTQELLKRGDAVIGYDSVNDYYDVSLKYARLAETGISESEIKDNQATQSSKHPDYIFYRANLTNQDVLNKVFEEHRITKVVNLAAQAGVRYSLENPHAYLDSNLTGFLNILEVCRHHKVEHLVYASSSSVYGLNKAMPFSVHHGVDHPISLYAASKKSNEMMAHSYSYLFGLPVTGLRFFTVYGPWGRPDMALFLFTDAILKGKPVLAFNNGNMARDFTYVDDIVGGITRVLDNAPVKNDNWDAEKSDPANSEAPYRVYNIGSNHPVKLMDFIHAIEKALGKKAEIQYQPMQPGDVKKSWADVEDLIRDFNYSPDTDIVTGVNSFIEWYQEFYKVDLPK